MASVIDYYGDNQDVIIANAGPGHWNDPDMVRMFFLRHEFYMVIYQVLHEVLHNHAETTYGVIYNVLDSRIFELKI